MSSASTIILITGANSGIGLASAEEIASSSDHYHVIIASRNAENGENAVKELRGKGNVKGGLSSVQLDVTDIDSISKAAKEVEKQFGRVDVLVNNAGISMNEGETKTMMEKTFQANTIGPALVFEAFKDLLLKSKSPYSIYMSSSLGSLDVAHDPNIFGYGVEAIPYRMSKAALNMWAVQEARLFGERGLKTFLMCPGFVVSNLRGKSEEARTGGGYAGDNRVSAQTLLSIIQGKRDADVGKFVHKDGVYPW